MMLMQLCFVEFLLVQVGLEILCSEAHCNPHQNKGCHQKETLKTTSTPTKIHTKTKPSVSLTTTKISLPLCNKTKCKSYEYCYCAKQSTRSWPVPPRDTCESIGCSLSGKDCECQGPDYCSCNGLYVCNPTECAAKSLNSGCYCYFGDKEIWVKDFDFDAGRKCSNLLREIGNHDGQYHCSAIPCECDQFDDCVCKTPKNKNPQTPKPKHCDSKQCEMKSFEFCQCTNSSCPIP